MQEIFTPSARADIIARRTYSRPLNDEETEFETWEDIVDRAIKHQEWLWARSQGYPLNENQLAELVELANLIYARKVCLAGRTHWLGGTEIAKQRESSMFNCSFTVAETVYDIVDILWLLLQGCGVGFKPVIGLTGFTKPIQKITRVRSERTGKGGRETNLETWDADNKVWTISVGDSAEAWAKSIGKLLAGKYPAKELILDFSEIRPAGERLKGYGWISSGDADIAIAYGAIAKILNKRAGSLLSKIDILDVVNWLGTVLSSRRSAEICLFDYGDSEWKEFATVKLNYWSNGNSHRSQSNNSLLFNSKPNQEQLKEIFDLMLASGGSEPGFINAEAALVRAPWFRGVNPCGEILLANKSFCCLTEIDVAKFRGDSAGLRRAAHILARANYRQTCVDLRDGILQEAWHLNNQFLHLCGVSITGVVRRPDLQGYELSELQRVATSAAYGMADELGLPHPKNVTTNKPSGTMAKVMDTTEGNHKPIGKYIFNNVTFAKTDPLVKRCSESNYNVIEKPNEPSSVLITLPVSYPEAEFELIQDDKEYDNESAISQLERYRHLMLHYNQQNVSQTVYYRPEEVEEIIQWFGVHWDEYVGVSFLLRQDPTKTAADLGHAYLPQEVVSKEEFENYVSQLQSVDLHGISGFVETEDESPECATGACPVK